MLLTSAVAVFIYFCIPRSMADPDIWWHLRNAEYLLHTHSFIYKDMYSFTASGAPWMNHEWLAELPFYFAYHWMGVRGLFVVTTGAIEAILLGVFYLAYRKSGSIKAAVLVSVAAAVFATVSFGPRTLLFGWICLVIELLLFDRAVRNEAWVWGLPLLFAVWVNTHGSWLIGMVVFLAFLVCGSLNLRIGMIEGYAWPPAFRKKLTIAYLMSAGALFANPYGWRLVLYPFDLAFRQKLNIANIEEWKSLDFHTPRGRIAMGCLAAIILLQLIRPRKWSPYELAFAGIGLYSAFTYSRFLFLAGILVMPLVAKSIPEIERRRTGKNKPLMNAAVLFVLVCLVVGRVRGGPHHALVGENKYPEQARDFLRGFHPEGRVLNDYMWGGYLIWNYRQIPVFVDSRVDIFEYNGTLRDYLDIVRLHDSLAILTKDHIRYVLFAKDAPLVYMLEHTGAWKTDYEDETTVLLERVAQREW